MLNAYDYNRYNAYLIPGEHRRRHRRIERAMEHTQESLDNQNVRRTMGRAAYMLKDISEMLFVPNVRNGVAIIPDKYDDEDKISVLAINPYECYAVRSMPPMPLQYDWAKRNAVHDWKLQGYEFSDADLELIAQKMYKPRAGLHKHTLSIGAAATCITPRQPYIHKGADGHKIMESRGRPHIVVGLGYLKKDSQEEVSSTLVHEMTHARENILCPQSMIIDLKYDNKRSLVSELIAYNAEGLFLRGLCGDERAARLGCMALEIDSIRQKYNGDASSPNAFYPSDDIEVALKKENLHHCYRSN